MTVIAVPVRWRDAYQQVCVDGSRSVMTSVGERRDIAYRWKCLRCGQLLKPNTAGAQSHRMKHVREVEKVAPPESGTPWKQEEDFTRVEPPARLRRLPYRIEKTR